MKDSTTNINVKDNNNNNIIKDNNNNSIKDNNTNINMKDSTTNINVKDNNNNNINIKDNNNNNIKDNNNDNSMTEDLKGSKEYSIKPVMDDEFDIISEEDLEVEKLMDVTPRLKFVGMSCDPNNIKNQNNNYTLLCKLEEEENIRNDNVTSIPFTSNIPLSSSVIPPFFSITSLNTHNILNNPIIPSSHNIHVNESNICSLPLVNTRSGVVIEEVCVK
jgi:alpha-glucosidase (family GH31 glycosyl hydrolase)